MNNEFALCEHLSNAIEWFSVGVRHFISTQPGLNAHWHHFTNLRRVRETSVKESRQLREIDEVGVLLQKPEYELVPANTVFMVRFGSFWCKRMAITSDLPENPALNASDVQQTRNSVSLRSTV
ncbi:MAG: hypothetical protein ACI9XZ_004421 [Alphaproteobacteria bacterium]